MKVTITFDIPDNQMIGYNNPCANYPNNPVNNPHASGFCNCALPALCNPMY